MKKEKRSEKHEIILYYRIGTPLRAYEVPRLYASTDDPKLAKKFEQQRDMNFFIRKDTYVDSVLQFQDRYKSTILRMCTFETSNPELLMKRQLDVTIPCTYQEEEKVFLQTDHVFHELGKEGTKFYPMYNCFNPLVKLSLKVLHYEDIMNFYKGMFQDPSMTVEEHLFSGFDGFGVLEDYSIKVDQLGLFLYYYGDTFKSKIGDT